ncbi:LysR family transcriptional regulator [Verticiella sediminum]|uniref:LysR family transcriptional regulator n=1 Tax=Verticiella sediminum TaxID=1247510 RepID=A0A556AIY2_9BURK|nr:LysR family transcriptional regulator [Verticiella sediminum]TSH92862.1 LysR family transcriptional regulator [Verticiella sediminum]
MDWTHRLRLRNLRMLLSLAQTQNISHSAAALNTTQPGLSKWLKELEDDIGLPLFERHARGLRPTAYGETLIAHARRLEAQLDRAAADMAALRAGGTGRVIIGASGASASDTVPLAVLRLLQQSPEVRVKLVEGTMDTLMVQLSRGDLDIVVGRSADDQIDADVRHETLYMEPLHMVARPRHPLAARASVQWQDLLGYRWLLWPRGTPIRQSLEKALAGAGLSVPADHIESNSVTINLTLLNATDMISVASHRSALRLSQMNTMRILPIRLPGFGSVAMYWRADPFRDAAVDEALDCLRAVAAAGTRGERDT